MLDFMNRLSWSAPIALLAVAPAAFTVFPSDGCTAQSRPAGQLYRLSSVIEAAGRSPFHFLRQVDDSARARMVPGSGLAVTSVPPRGGGRWVMLRETGRKAAADDVSMARVFVGSAIGATVADLAAVGIFAAALYMAADDPLAEATLVGLPLVVVLGPAIGARAVGADLGAALAGSFLGAGLGLAILLAGADSGVHVSILAPSILLVQAGMTTIFAGSDWWWG